MQAAGERRVFRRIGIDFEINEILAGVTSRVRAVELGELGMRYLKPVDKPFPLDRQVTLELRLPGDEQLLRVRGWIAGQNAIGDSRHTSVTFAFLNDHDAKRLCEFVAQRS